MYLYNHTVSALVRQQHDGRKYAFHTNSYGKPALVGFVANTFIYITNEYGGTKLFQQNMIDILNGLRKK